MRQSIRIVVLFAALLAIYPVSGFSQGAAHKRLGMGVQLGEPLGFASRLFFVDRFAADLVVGYGFAEEGLIIQPSLLLVLRDILDYDGPNYSIVPHFGAGLKTGIDAAGANDGEAIAALRFPIGVNWVIQEGIFEISLEFGPGVEFSPETQFDGTGGISLRYYLF